MYTTESNTCTVFDRDRDYQSYQSLAKRTLSHNYPSESKLIYLQIALLTEDLERLIPMSYIQWLKCSGEFSRKRKAFLFCFFPYIASCITRYVEVDTIHWFRIIRFCILAVIYLCIFFVRSRFTFFCIWLTRSFIKMFFFPEMHPWLWTCYHTFNAFSWPAWPSTAKLTLLTPFDSLFPFFRNPFRKDQSFRK